MAMITALQLGDQRPTGVTPHQSGKTFLPWSRSSTIPIIYSFSKFLKVVHGENRDTLEQVKTVKTNGPKKPSIMVKISLCLRALNQKKSA
jgi:hypothetical protein